MARNSGLGSSRIITFSRHLIRAFPCEFVALGFRLVKSLLVAGKDSEWNVNKLEGILFQLGFYWKLKKSIELEFFWSDKAE